MNERIISFCKDLHDLLKRHNVRLYFEEGELELNLLEKEKGFDGIRYTVEYFRLMGDYIDPDSSLFIRSSDEDLVIGENDELAS